MYRVRLPVFVAYTDSVFQDEWKETLILLLKGAHQCTIVYMHKHDRQELHTGRNRVLKLMLEKLQHRAARFVK